LSSTTWTGLNVQLNAGQTTAAIQAQLEHFDGLWRTVQESPDGAAFTVNANATNQTVTFRDLAWQKNYTGGIATAIRISLKCINGTIQQTTAGGNELGAYDMKTGLTPAKFSTLLYDGTNAAIALPPSTSNYLTNYEFPVTAGYSTDGFGSGVMALSIDLNFRPVPSNPYWNGTAASFADSGNTAAICQDVWVSATGQYQMFACGTTRGSTSQYNRYSSDGGLSYSDGNILAMGSGVCGSHNGNIVYYCTRQDVGTGRIWKYTAGANAHMATTWGQEFSDLGAPNVDWSKIACSRDGQYVLAGTQSTTRNNGGYVYISANGGSTWSAVSLASVFQHIYGVAMSGDGRHMFATTSENTIRYSPNSGMNWYTANGPSGSIGSINNPINIRCSASGQIVACTTTDGFLVSRDYGANFSNSNGSTTADSTLKLTGCCMSSNGEFILKCYYSGKIGYSKNFGRTWDSENVSLTGAPDLNCIACSDTGGYAATGPLAPSRTYNLTYNPTDTFSNNSIELWCNDGYLSYLQSSVKGGGPASPMPALDTPTARFDNSTAVGSNTVSELAQPLPVVNSFSYTNTNLSYAPQYVTIASFQLVTADSSPLPLLPFSFKLESAAQTYVTVNFSVNTSYPNGLTIPLKSSSINYGTAGVAFALTTPATNAAPNMGQNTLITGTLSYNGSATNVTMTTTSNSNNGGLIVQLYGAIISFSFSF
jgi:hypothetical protein